MISFDPVLAATLRWPAELIRNALLLLLALTVVISMQTVGVGLVAAMLVTPPATAYLLTKRLPAMMGLSALFGGLSAILGLVYQFLREYRLRPGHRPDRHRILRDRLPVFAHGKGSCLSV